MSNDSQNTPPQVEGDPTALEALQREVAILLAASQALGPWEGFQRGGERLLHDLAGAAEQTAGALWLPEQDVIVARATWSAPSVDRGAFESSLRDLRVPRGVGLAGSAWERAELTDRARASAHLSPGQSTPGDLRATVAIPAVSGEAVLGVVELYSASDGALSERVMHVLSAAGLVLGAALARRRGELMLPPLTPRELDVLTLVAAGLTRPKIGDELSISSATVKTHLGHIYNKLGVVNRPAAVAHALRAGLID
jgi:DNA-binding CsgD family transcriptional regulator